MPITPSQDDVITALRAFLLDRLQAGVEVDQGVVNRVPEPSVPNYVIMTLMRTTRLSTNVNTPQDVRFTGAIAPMSAAFVGSIAPAPAQPGIMPSGILTVSAMIDGGTIVPGAAIGGAQGMITGQISGAPGGAGIYAVSQSQSVLSGPLSVSYGLMTASAVAFGTIAAGASVFGIGMPPTIITGLGSGTGGAGTYVVLPSQTFASGTLAAGYKTQQQNSRFDVQVDFYGLIPSVANDMAMTIATSFRDPYAATFFKALGLPISPLYADDPRYMPFADENQQIETRWSLECALQVNQSLRVPAQYADVAAVVVISTDAGPPYP